MSQKDFVISVDTTIKGGTLCLAAVSEKGSRLELLGVHGVFHNQGVAASLAGICTLLLRSAGLSFADIRYLQVATGPGSFTGIKVGLSFASGIVLAHPHIKVLGVSSLELLAQMYPGHLIFLPATKKQGYAAMVEKDGGKSSLYSAYLEEGESPSVTLAAETNPDTPISLDQLQAKCCQTILPWRELELALSGATYQTDYEELDYQSQGVAVASFGLKSSFTMSGQSPVALDRVPEPRYLRKSAPEQALAKKGVLS